MVDILLTNSLTGKKEKFIPIKKDIVGMYTCGPTVYDYAHIGNFRTNVTADILLRTLKYNGLKVNYVMNLTDVGHLTGDNSGDADSGEDKLEKAARREGKTAWDIAKYYSEIFIKETGELNLLAPDTLPKATDHIKEQIALIRRLEEKDFTYKTSDGVYFDTSKFEKTTGRKYCELSTLDKIKEGARVKINPEKKSPRDFALWRHSPLAASAKGGQSGQAKRYMEWESPWGIGFPGWHIECSAMSMKYLGESFDIHVGGEDLRSTHHPNEIVQSEGATGKRFVRYWIHVTFLQVDGKKMSKSLGNIYTISDIKKKGFDPLALRYLYLTSHYRDSLNFTWSALESAQNALNNLRNQVTTLRELTQRSALSEEKRKKIEEFSRKFREAVNNDLNTSQALAVLWGSIKSNIPSEDKYDLAMSFDEVLGLGLNKLSAPHVQQIPISLGKIITTPTPISAATISRIEERELVRDKGDYETADKLREKIFDKDKIQLRDTDQGTVVEPAQNEK